MPKCVDCGTETDRDQMYGPPDELRCPACVRKLEPIYDRSYGLAGPPPPPRVTFAILGIATIASLLYWVHNADVEPIIARLFVQPPAIWDGQIWRFLTSCFFHVNFLHLLFNLYWVWRFGQRLEGWMGWLRYAGFFVLVGVGSSAVQFLADPGSAIGLSGVGYAMFGLLLALRRDKDFAAEEMQPQVVQLFVFWFFLCIVLTYANFMPVANVAHGAGAVIGWLLGQAVLTPWRKLAVPGVIVLVLAMTALTQYMPWDRHYALYRGVQALKQNDLPTALYWFEKAQGAAPGLQRTIDALHDQIKSDKSERSPD